MEMEKKSNSVENLFEKFWNLFLLKLLRFYRKVNESFWDEIEIKDEDDAKFELTRFLNRKKMKKLIGMYFQLKMKIKHQYSQIDEQLAKS